MNKRYVTKVLSLAVFSLMLSAVAGCRSHTSAVSVPTVEAVEVYSPEDVRAALLADAAAPWSAVTIPVRLQLQSPVSATVSGRLTMERDKCIYLSLRMIGMEVAYLYADTDSLYAVDKFHKRYFSADISDLQYRYGLSLGNLQDFLLGRIFLLAGDDRLPAARNVIFQERVVYLLEPEPQDMYKSIFVAEASSDNRPALVSFAVELSDKRGLTCYYGTPVRTSYGSIASDLTLRIIADSMEGVARIAMSPAEAKWNEKASAVRFRLPSGYDRVTVEQLMAMLGKN